MRLIGITGGVGAGKTQLLSYIKRHYRCEVYLADEAAHKVEEPGNACYQELVSLLGERILAKDGTIDKKKMAACIFEEEELLRQVNAIVHPAVREYLEQAVDRAKKDGRTELVFIEAALLIESGYGDFVDEMWYVYAAEDVRRERLKAARGYGDDRIDDIMKSQLSEEEFRAGSDFVIDNSGALEEAYSRIRKRLEAYTWQE